MPLSVLADPSKLHAVSSVHPKTSITGKLTDNGCPKIFENINPDRQSSEIFPVSSTSVPSPTGTTDPVKENAKTVVPLADTVNPLAVASPPAAPSTQPSCENWKPAISDVLE